MSWQNDMVIILRNMINDTDTPYTYTDSRLQEVILVASQLIITNISFLNQYTINFTDISLTPDPTDTSNRDDAFINLTSLKAACMLTNAEAKIAAGQAISIKDGSSAVELKGIGQAKMLIAKYFCDAFSQSQLEYLAGSKCPGEFIVTPYRIQQADYYLPTNDLR